MPEIRSEELTEEELLSLLERNLDAADTYSESLIGEQRDKAHRFYFGELIGNEIKGRSQHVSRDVFDAVESTKALMLDTFTADRRVVEFMPQTNQDVDKARQATAWVNYLFYRQNDGYKILHDTIHDGLVSKLGVVKRWWDARIVKTEEKFAGLSEPEFFGLASQPDVEITEVVQETLQEAVVDPMNGMVISPAITIISGTLKRSVDKSQVRIENVEPERLYISPRAKTLEDSDFVSYRTEKEIGELIEDGYDTDKIEKLDEELDSWAEQMSGRDSYDEFSVEARGTDDHPNRSHVTIY